jgi:hypothetical protein
LPTSYAKHPTMQPCNHATMQPCNHSKHPFQASSPLRFYCSGKSCMPVAGISGYIGVVGSCMHAGVTSSTGASLGQVCCERKLARPHQSAAASERICSQVYRTASARSVPHTALHLCPIPHHPATTFRPFLPRLQHSTAFQMVWVPPDSFYGQVAVAGAD